MYAAARGLFIRYAVRVKAKKVIFICTRGPPNLSVQPTPGGAARPTLVIFVLDKQHYCNLVAGVISREMSRVGVRHSGPEIRGRFGEERSIKQRYYYYYNRTSTK